MVASFSLGAWKVRTGAENKGEELLLFFTPRVRQTVACVEHSLEKTPPFATPALAAAWCPKTFKVLKHGGTDYNLLKTWCLLGLLRAFEEYFEVGGVLKCRFVQQTIVASLNVRSPGSSAVPRLPLL